MEVPNKEYTRTGMKEAYSPYTAGRLARRAYARPGSEGEGCIVVRVGDQCLKNSLLCLPSMMQPYRAP